MVARRPPPLRLAATLLAALPALAGCPHRRAPGGDVADVGSRAAPGGAASPEEALALLEEAHAPGGALALYRGATAETQRVLMAAALLGATLATLGPDLDPDPAAERELRELMARHHLEARAPAPDAGETDGAEAPAPEVPEPEPAAPARGAAALEPQLAGVADRAGLYAELVAFVARSGRSPLPRYERAAAALEVEGDLARTRVVTRDAEGRLGEEAVELRRVGGRWYVHLPEADPGR